MGCCWSGEDDESFNDQSPNERTRLLNNPVSDGPSSMQHNGYNTPAAASQNKGDEQSALNRILHQTASNVIDVSAMDSQSMEHDEYMVRAKQYNAKIAAAMGHSSRAHRKPLPAGVAAPHTVLAAQTLSAADLYLISNAAEQASKAIKDIKVRHKEDLVVPFGVP